MYARLNDTGLWDIWEVAALGGTPRRLILNAKDPAWSRDGKWLAYADNATRGIWIADAAGQNARKVTEVKDFCCQHAEPAFSPDGRHLVFTGNSVEQANIGMLEAAQ